MPSSRPATLEPSACMSLAPINPRENTNNELRHKALAEALPLGEPDSDTTHSLEDCDPDLYHAVSMRGNRRKRQRVNKATRLGNLIQLPRPPEQNKVDKPPPFQPVSSLTELHEPPPSAALFPPITPSVDGCQSVPSRASQNRPIFAGSAYQNQKRINLRPRLKWTEQETVALLKGVEMFGQGKWKKILSYSPSDFNQERTAVDLKDRYRTCRANGLTRASCGWSSSATDPRLSIELRITPGNDLPIASKLSETPVQRAPSIINKQPSENDGSLAEKKTLTDTSLPNFTAVNTPHPTSKTRHKKSLRAQTVGSSSPEIVRKRKPKNHWTEEEDGFLAEGYRKHGFQWTLITKDLDLGLSHRSGPQVRDRFRLKYPDIYLPPMPGPPLEERLQKSFSKSTNQLDRQDTIASPPLPMLSLRLQPLSSDLHESSSDNEGQLFDSDSSSRKTESRQTTILPDEVEARHLGIEGLLNGEDGEGPEDGKLPSFKYTYDDWEGDSSMTLPPLLWEHMATRPIFELDEGD